MKKRTIEQIAARAELLNSAMNRQAAIECACREAGVGARELNVNVDLVNTAMRNAELNPSAEKLAADARHEAVRSEISAMEAKHLAEIQAEMEAKAAKGGGDWGRARLAALRAGTPRTEDVVEANRRATIEHAKRPRGRPSDVPGETADSIIHFRVLTRRKSAYVRESIKRGQTLANFLTNVADQAADFNPDPTRIECSGCGKSIKPNYDGYFICNSCCLVLNKDQNNTQKT